MNHSNQENPLDKKKGPAHGPGLVSRDFDYGSYLHKSLMGPFVPVES
jgi:hypothetical protein